jgi:hypothetical protein
MCRGFISCYFRILFVKNEFESNCPYRYGLLLCTGKKLNLLSIGLGLIVFILTESILHFVFLYETFIVVKTSERLICSYLSIGSTGTGTLHHRFVPFVCYHRCKQNSYQRIVGLKRIIIYFPNTVYDILNITSGTIK